MTNFPAVVTYSTYASMDDKNGVFAFLDLDTCFVCTEYLKELQKYDKSEWTIVACPQTILELRTPTTIIFNNNKEVYRREGVLYSTQMREIYEILDGNTDKMANLFTFTKAVTKSQEVQSMFFKSDANFKILGKEYNVKAGQWLVLWPDNKVDVYDNREYDNRFQTT